MSESEPLTGEQREFERALKQLRPAAPKVDEAGLIYRAGQEAARRESIRQLRRWQLSTLTASVCALVAVSMSWFPQEREVIPERSLANNRNNDSTPEPISENEDPINVVTQQENRVVETIEDVPEPVNPSVFARWWGDLTTVSVSDQNSYLGLRNRVLEHGTDALPQIRGGDGGAQSEPFISSPRKTRELLDTVFPSQI